jgi:predicted MPP superfamily phosphohydrolase
LAVAFVLARSEHRLFGTLRYCAWGTFAHGPLLLLGGAALLRGPWRAGLAAAAAGVLVAGAHAFVQEPFALELTRLEVTSAKVARPLRIGLVADLQTDAPGAYERRALELVLAAAPDVILFAGDYVHERDHAELERHWSALNAILRDVGLRAPLGVYAVQGDVDAWGWHAVFSGLDAELFDATRSVDLSAPAGAPGVRITGLSYADGRDPDLALAGAEGFHVVLSHRPDFALGDVDADLLLAGHTHGGQVKLPFLGAPILLSRIPRAWGDGWTELSGGRALYVSRGVGMERGDAPRLRFLCPPEVVVIDVLPVAVGSR